MADNSLEQFDDFVALLTSRQRQLFVYILSMVGDETRANDILQNTNKVLWSKRADFTPGTNFAAWASRFAYWQVMDFSKRNKLDRHLFDDELLGEMAKTVEEIVVSANSRLGYLDERMDELPETQRTIVQARYEPGNSIEDIAQQEGRSTAAMSQFLYRIRQRLMRCIEGKLAKEGNHEQQ